MKKAFWLTSYTFAITILIATVWIVPFKMLYSCLFTGILVITLIGLYLSLLKFSKYYKAFITILIIEIIVLYGYIAMYYSGLSEHFSSIESAREWFASFGMFTWIVFFLIQLLQVIILPIPAQITTIAGILIFQPWIAFLISTVAVIIGSIICFAIGKSLGVSIAYKIASKENVDKYRKLISEKGRVLLPIMFLFPFFPDDLLCFVAGTTTMSWAYFLIVTATCRVVGIACICLFGSGEIIPFSGWGISVWIVLIVVLLIACYFLMKYQKQIEEKIISIFTKGKTSSKNEKTNKDAEQYAVVKEKSITAKAEIGKIKSSEKETDQLNKK